MTTINASGGSNVANNGSQISTGKKSSNSMKTNSKIEFRTKTFWGGFLSGIITSIIGSVLYNIIF